MVSRIGGMRGRLANGALGVLLVLGMAVTGCSTLNSAGDKISNVFTGGSSPAAGSPGYVSGFLGGVVVDEPRAALVARQVLSSGGTAADAAVAAAFMLSVTLPSRAGLGGGGACMTYDPDRHSANGGVPEALLFVPPPGGGSGERPAAVPAMARAMYALNARYGRMQFDALTIFAEQGARLGVQVSRAFASDLAVVAGPLSADPVARAVFLQPNGQPLGEGMALMQPDLGATLAQMRVAGVGDLYNGVLANRLVAAAAQAGGGLTMAALRDTRPSFAPAIIVDAPGHDRAAFLPPPADGGLAAAAAFASLTATPNDLRAAQNRALAVAATWRGQGGQGNPAALLAMAGPVQAAPLPALPASTNLVTLDRDGRAVACSFTMNNLFGTGRIAPGTGVLLAASPSWMAPPLLVAGIGWNPNTFAFHAAVAASGQEGAPLAGADVLMQSLRAPRPLVFDSQARGGNTAIDLTPPTTVNLPVNLRPAPEPGRADVIGCAGYLPGDKGSCSWSIDPRNAGLAVGSN
jgi:gamma-glutamyltranspeptidase/glutathione hydrolase